MSALCPYVKTFYSILLNSEKFKYAITGFQSQEQWKKIKPNLGCNGSQAVG
jgi:hypothetical protein